MQRRPALVLACALVAGTLGASFGGPAQAARPGAAELVLHDGRIWTGTGATASALAVRGQRVVALGGASDVRPLVGPGTRVVDLNGAFVTPGLRDQHVHLLDTGIPGVEAGATPPAWDGYDPVEAEVLRGAVAAFHASILARGETPESGCTESEVTEELKSKILASEQEVARQGLTATVEAGLSDLGALQALLELAEEGRLTVRWLPRIGAGCLEQAAERGWVTGFGNEWVRVLGAKLYADGWLGPRTSALREPYDDRPYDGMLFLAPDEALAEVRRARELGFNVTTHAIGDRGIATVLDAYEAAGVSAADRWQVEHAQVTDLPLIDRFADLDVIGSVQLSFATTDQRFAEDALGPERLATSYAWRTMADRGVRLVGSSDFPVEVLAPLWGLQRVVTRVEFDGTPPGGFLPQERIDLPTALRLVTSDAAYASLEEDDRGTLEVGKYADLTVIREDLLKLPADCLAATTVLMTLVNGQVAFEGEQAYPPGDASCPSGAAPADSPVLASGGLAGPGASGDGAGPDTASGGRSLPATGGGVAGLAAVLLLAVAFVRRRYGSPASD